MMNHENKDTQDNFRWFKGVTHAHTLNSDGDSSPSEVKKVDETLEPDVVREMDALWRSWFERCRRDRER